MRRKEKKQKYDACLRRLVQGQIMKIKELQPQQRESKTLIWPLFNSSLTRVNFELAQFLREVNSNHGKNLARQGGGTRGCRVILFARHVSGY